MVTMCDQHENVHGQLLIQCGDAAHHRVWLPNGHRRMSRSHSVFLFPEHRRFNDPSTLAK